jgi:hypothetical protein
LIDSKFFRRFNFPRIKITEKKEILEKISLIFFCWLSLLFIINLQYNLTNGYDEIIFFISIVPLFCVIIYQIFFSKVNSIIILFEIFMIYLFLHLIYQIGYSGLRGSDSYLDYNFLKEILSNGHFTLGQDIYGVRGWPILHIFSTINSLLTNINPLIIAKFLPSFISSIIVIPIYLLIYEVYKNKKLALFLCLLFGSITQFGNFEALFVRESLALLIMILFFYLLYISKKRDSSHLIVLALLCIPLVVFTHHLTSFLILILLSIYILALKVAPFLYEKFNLYRDDKLIKLSGKINIELIFLIILLGVISYWINSATNILKVFIGTFVEKEEVTVSYAARINLGAPILTLKGYIIYYGFYFFNFLFALLLLIKIKLKENKQIIEDVSFGFFFFFCMFLGFLSLYFIPEIGFPQRFLPYGMMFGLIPLGGIVICLKKDTYKKIIVILLAFFFLYNLYCIDPAYPSGDVNLPSNNTGDKEYAIAMTIKFPHIYYGYYAVVGAIYDIQGIKQRTGGLDISMLPNNKSNISSSTPIVISTESYVFKDVNLTKQNATASYIKKQEILSLKNQRDINKICDLGNVYILQRRE